MYQHHAVKTKELAVLVDMFYPLSLTKDALEDEKPATSPQGWREAGSDSTAVLIYSGFIGAGCRVVTATIWCNRMYCLKAKFPVSRN